MTFSHVIMGIGAIGFVYAFFKKPDWIAIVLFTTIIADMNFDLPAIPLNFRSLLCVILFGKIIAEGKNPYENKPSFFSLSYTWSISFFVVYIFLVSAKFGLFNMEMFKEFILSVIAAYLGYYYYFKKNGYEIFKISIILGGLVTFGDLAYTYVFAGGFPVQRWYYLFVPGFQFFNHNFFGYICGASFVFLLSDYLNSESKLRLNLYLMPVMFLGTLISTSRSALLMVFLVSFVLISRGLVSQKKGKKAYTLVMITLACFFITLFIFQIAAAMLGSHSEFMKTISARLIDEPVAMLNRFLGKNYNANNLDSMDWRAEASTIAYDSYIGLLPEEKIFGIGYNGFLFRDYGHGYDAHNGILLMMIEFGMFGFLFYMILLGNLIVKAAKLGLSSPFAVTLVYMILYITSHNKELTAFFAFLVTGSLAAEIQYKLVKEEEEHAASRMKINMSHQN